MDDELWYGVIENQAHYYYSSLFYPSFCLFKARFVSYFSKKLLKIESLTLVHIHVCRMSGCITGLRLLVMAFILLCSSIFLFFPYFACLH